MWVFEACLHTEYHFQSTQIWVFEMTFEGGVGYHHSNWIMILDSGIGLKTASY